MRSTPRASSVRGGSCRGRRSSRLGWPRSVPGPPGLAKRTCSPERTRHGTLDAQRLSFGHLRRPSHGASSVHQCSLQLRSDPWKKKSLRYAPAAAAFSSRRSHDRPGSGESLHHRVRVFHGMSACRRHRDLESTLCRSSSRQRADAQRRRSGVRRLPRVCCSDGWPRASTLIRRTTETAPM